MPRLRTLALLPVVALLTACAGPSTQTSPTAAPTAVTAAPAAQQPASQPTAPARPTVAATPAAPRPIAAAAAPVATASPAATAQARPAEPGRAAAPTVAPAADGTLRLVLPPEGSEARYRAREQLAGRPLASEAVGATRAVSGSVILAPSGALVPDQSKVVVDLRTLRSDEPRRDNWIQRNTLETARFPNAELVLREAPGLPLPLPSAGQATLQLVGDLTVHGVTRPTTWEVNARFGEHEITGLASTRVKMSDFGMTPPRVGPVLGIEDELILELEFRAARAGSPGAALGALDGEPALTPALSQGGDFPSPRGRGLG